MSSILEIRSRTEFVVLRYHNFRTGHPAGKDKFVPVLNWVPRMKTCSVPK